MVGDLQCSKETTIYNMMFWLSCCGERHIGKPLSKNGIELFRCLFVGPMSSINHLGTIPYIISTKVHSQ